MKSTRNLSSSIKLSKIQQMLSIPFFALNSIANPDRADHVALLGDATAPFVLKRLRDDMKQTREGHKLLIERPVITSSSLQTFSLDDLPDGTFGHEYSRYMDKHGFDADKRPPVKFIEDEELAYVMLRYRQVHDFWHTLTGLPPTVLGEIALKWFEWRVTGLPSCALSSLCGPLRLSRDERRILQSVYIPWALESGKCTRGLMSYYYEENLSLPIEDVRLALNLIPAPILNCKKLF